MGYLKQQLLMLVPLKPHMWLRFTDDIDIQWRHGRKDLYEFLDKAHAFHKTIKFTSDISNDNHIFLGKSHIKGSQLVRDLYLNPTDSHQYLLQTTCHPRNCCKNIPYSLALRIRRKCSQEADYERRTHELSSYLCRCGYKSEYVGKAITKASSMQRHETPKYKSNTIRNTFCSNVPPLSPQNIRHHWQTLANYWNKRKAHLYFPEKPMIAFKRP